jgi:Rrf2 family nitric oxide-sensitive transcriptional repressor
MRLSVQTDYALRTLMFLASTDGHHSINEIARQYGISRNHLMKVAQRLAANGYVESVLGRGGGLKLAQPAHKLNVGHVVRTFEDLGNFVECFNAETNDCVVTPVCGLHGVLSGGLKVYLAYLDKFTIADLIGNREKFRRVLDSGPGLKKKLVRETGG